MALRIDTNLTSMDGASVPSGSHVKMELYFPMTEDSYNVSMKIWRNKSAYVGGLQPYRPKEIPQLNFTKNLTPAEMSGLTPTQVHIDTKAYLETYVGEGNVDIVE
jgi:hypothetical protein